VARAVLTRALTEVRDRGWAVDNEENVAGQASIAAPIRGYGGLVVGAIGVFGAVERVCDGQPNPVLVGYVRDAARAVSRDLGASRW
jgi:DNA-binding IclR family transcriptional regulator